MIVVPQIGAEILASIEAAGNTIVAELLATGADAMTVLSTGQQAAVIAAGGFAAGGITGGNIESAILGAFQAAASFGIGQATGHGNLRIGGSEYFQNVLAHAALGCGVSAAQGGSCKSGAMAAGFSAAAGPVISGLTNDNFYAGLAGRMAVGCAGSKLGGGSCEAGAVTAAFDYLYNKCNGGGALSCEDYAPGSMGSPEANRGELRDAAGDRPALYATAGLGALATGGAAYGALLVAPTTTMVLTELAGAAAASVGAGSGSVYGTYVHTAFGKLVSRVQGLHSEVSYLNGQLVRNGLKGSIRIDVVEGAKTAPKALYDLKTGGATLTPARIQQIQQHVPGGSRVPVIEIRPPK